MRGPYWVEDLARIYVMVGESDAAIDQLEYLLSMPGEFFDSFASTRSCLGPLTQPPPFQEAPEGVPVKLVAGDSATLATMDGVALGYIRQARYEDAECLLLEAFGGREARLGPEHPPTLNSLRELVRLYESRPKPDEAATWRAKLPRREDAAE